MGIYAVAVDISSGKEMYRLVRHDGVMKVAPKEFLLQRNIDIDNLTIKDGKIIPFNTLPKINGPYVENKNVLTILTRNYRQYKVCSFEGKTAEFSFEDISEARFTNASIIEYCNFLGQITNAFKFCNETYEEAVDSLLEDGLKTRESLDGGKLEKTILKLNMLGNNAKYKISEDGELQISSDSSNNILNRFVIPKGVKLVKSVPKCETLIGCETLEGIDITHYNAEYDNVNYIKNIDLSMCELITDFNNMRKIVGATNTIEIFKFPRNLTTLGVDDGIHNDLSHAKEIYIGPYIKCIKSKMFRKCTAKIFEFENVDKLRLIGSYAFYQCSRIPIDFTKCMYLTSIGEFAFNEIGDTDKIELDLSKCVNLTNIGYKAFYKTKLEVVKLPNNLKNIDTCAFYCGRYGDKERCLKYINIPSSITKQGFINIVDDIRFNIVENGIIDIPVNVSNKFKNVVEMSMLYKLNSRSNFNVTINIVQ